jgi:hypothetical protein
MSGLSLGHQALLTLVKSGIEVDFSDPVIRDQFFSVNVKKTEHLQRMHHLRAQLAQKKSKAYKIGNFRSIAPVQFYMIDKVAFEIADDLFDVFTWDTVKTPAQTQWKEYFHSLYELLVLDRNDHIGNLIMIKALVGYHDVLEEPSCEPDVNDTVIHNLRRLFRTFKREQVLVSQNIGDLHFHMKESVRIAMEVQLDMNAIHRELRQLYDEVRTFNEILMSVPGRFGAPVSFLQNLDGVE